MNLIELNTRAFDPSIQNHEVVNNMVGDLEELRVINNYCEISNSYRVDVRNTLGSCKGGGNMNIMGMGMGMANDIGNSNIDSNNALSMRFSCFEISRRENYVKYNNERVYLCTEVDDNGMNSGSIGSNKNNSRYNKFSADLKRQYNSIMNIEEYNKEYDEHENDNIERHENDDGPINENDLLIDDNNTIDNNNTNIKNAHKRTRCLTLHN